MKAIIKYDNGETEEVELEKKEVIPSDQGNVAHFKYVKLDKSKSIVIHVYLPTTEEPNVRAIDIGKEVVERKTSISRYNNIADDLITRAKFMSPSVDKCVFCGDLASNTFKGKKVCSSCFAELNKHGEASEEFSKYLRNKTIHKWNS